MPFKKGKSKDGATKQGGSSFGGAGADRKGRALKQGSARGEHDSIGSMPAHARHRFVAVNAALALVNAKEQGKLSDDEIVKMAEFSGADRLCPGCGSLFGKVESLSMHMEECVEITSSEKSAPARAHGSLARQARRKVTELGEFVSQLDMDQELNVAVGERMCKAFGWESTRALAAFSICEQVKASNAMLSTQRQGEHYQQLDKIRSIWVPALSPQDRQGAETARLTGMNPNQRGLASGSRISHERQDDIVQGIVNPFTFSATLKIIRRSDEMLETMTKIGGWWEVNTTPVAQADRYVRHEMFCCSMIDISLFLFCKGICSK